MTWIGKTACLPQGVLEMELTLRLVVLKFESTIMRALLTSCLNLAMRNYEVHVNEHVVAAC